MIPHRVALALQADGWIVRQELVWSKPAPMPESVKDRCTRSHETVFMLAKKERYYYDADAIRELLVTAERSGPRRSYDPGSASSMRNGAHQAMQGPFAGLPLNAAGRNKRSVWTVGPQPLGEEHYAAFPEKLITPMVLAGTSEAGCCPRCAAPWRRVVEREPSTWEHRKALGEPPRKGLAGAAAVQHMDGKNPALTASRPTITTGWQAGCSCEAGPPLPCTTLDPFLGSGTVALVSKRLGRSCVGIELNPAYCDLAQRRVESVPYTLFSGATSTTGAAR